MDGYINMKNLERTGGHICTQPHQVLKPGSRAPPYNRGCWGRVIDDFERQLIIYPSIWAIVRGSVGVGHCALGKRGTNPAFSLAGLIMCNVG